MIPRTDELPDARLRLILTCGEGLREQDARRRQGALRLRRRQPVRADRDDHGVLEAHRVALATRRAPWCPRGRAEANARLYVVDRHGGLAPIGAPGELLVGGLGLARGYLNRPELTAERFGADPFCAAPGARVHRTGDLVRYRERRVPRVPRARRRPGEDPWPPSRARRGRGRARAVRRCRPGRGCGPDRRRRGPSAVGRGRVRSRRRPARHRRRPLAARADAPCLHGAGGDRDGRAAPAHTERQGGPGRARLRWTPVPTPTSNTPRRAPRRSTCSRSSGPRCSASSGSGSTTTSSPPAETRCWARCCSPGPRPDR